MKTAKQHTKKIFIILTGSLLITAVAGLLIVNNNIALKLPYTPFYVSDFGIPILIGIWILAFDFLILVVESRP